MSSPAQALPLLRNTPLHDVAWEQYERVLQEAGDGPTRVTFLDGSMEIISPLPEHEDVADAMGTLVRELTMEAGLPVRGFGSTTYRSEDRAAGLEPDRCYYIANESKVRGMKRFDPKLYPPPDLAIEVDVTSRSISRESVYARLGVPEIWRYSAAKITVRVLTGKQAYQTAPASLIFPFLPMKAFERFVQRMLVEEQNHVVREFRQWVRALPR